MIRLTETDLLILRIINSNTANYSYGVFKEIAENHRKDLKNECNTSDKMLSLKGSIAYRITKLESAGLIEYFGTEYGEGLEDRRLIRLTEEGRKAIGEAS